MVTYYIIPHETTENTMINVVATVVIVGWIIGIIGSVIKVNREYKEK